MADDVLLNKAASIERCLRRIQDEYIGHEAELETNLSRQDAIVLNLQRACETSIDAAMHLVRKNKLGLPERSRDGFQLLIEQGLLEASLGERLMKMVGFRNIAVHQYQSIDLRIVRRILESHLVDFANFARLLVQQS